MDTRQLNYILTIAECGSISRAANKLFISQSGLNQQLQRIEKELGISLFKRDTHHLAITESGTIFLRYARETLNREKQMYAMISDVMDGNVGEIRVNLAMEQGIELFCEIFPEFHAKYPLVELKLEDHIVYDQYKFLAEGKLDIGMVMVKNHEIEDLEYVHSPRGPLRSSPDPLLPAHCRWRLPGNGPDALPPGAFFPDVCRFYLPPGH